jgi:hypothetical protein
VSGVPTMPQCSCRASAPLATGPGRRRACATKFRGLGRSRSDIFRSRVCDSLCRLDLQLQSAT